MTETTMILVFFGLVASGKSYLAKAWAARHGCLYLNTDVVRKNLAGVTPTSRQVSPPGEGLYSEEMGSKTYRAMRQEVQRELTRPQPRCLVLDGSYRQRRERQLLREGLPTGGRLFFVFCLCSEEETKRRLQQRAADTDAVSDGTWEIYQRQRHLFEWPSELSDEELLRLDTEHPLPELLAQIALALPPKDQK